MRKTLIASVMMLICTLAAMANSPSSQGGKAMSPFKFKAEQPQSLPRQSNITTFHDLTSDNRKKDLNNNGISVSYSFEKPTAKDAFMNTIKTPAREGEQSYTLTVNLKYDKNEVEELVDGLVFSNNNQEDWFYCDWTEEMTPDKIAFNLPSGEYDIEVRLQTVNLNFIILTASKVTVDCDKEITLDASDATVEIFWEPKMPDGTTPNDMTTICDPETLKVVDRLPGNALIVYNFLDIFNKKHNSMGSMMFSPSTVIIGDSISIINQGNIKTMPNNDYTFYLKTAALTFDGGYAIALMADALTSTIIKSDLNNYVTLKPEFAETPYEAEPKVYIDEENQVVVEFDRDNAFSISFATIIDNKIYGRSRLSSIGKNKIDKCIYVCQDPTLSDKYQVMPIPMLFEDWDSDFNTTCPPVSVVADSYTAFVINNTSVYNPYLYFPDENDVYIKKVANPWLSFELIKPHIWNYGCPSLVSSTVNVEEDAYYSIRYAYIGRLGENRGTDLLSTKIELTVDGEVPSDEIIENFQWGQLPEVGEINLEFIDTNVAIDGIPGKNVARVGFDMSRDDWEPPTLQIVRFVDTDNNFTDRYAIGEDGVIEFYGGDFTYHYNSENYAEWYTEEPAAEVKVEYAPYGTESFLPLEVENIPERDFMPGFGTYYRGSLAAVDRKSENGWFDVRITLTDAAGNFQEQTLSPAFKIDSSVGVETIAAPEIAVSVANGSITVCGCENPLIEVYTPDGILLSRSASSSIDAKEFTHGIYLISVTDGSRHVLRKIRL